ncbi:phage tail tip protein J-related protein [Escherichia coli]|uniref:phage tail tip protein J-related protein n=1 Tax=Escherichia coli TaxID=562 RepID=UPI004042D0F8
MYRKKRPSWITRNFGRRPERTVNGVTPAVQHLTSSHRRQRGIPCAGPLGHAEVVKGVSFLLRLTVAADDGRERLVANGLDETETTYRFTQLALGNQADVRGSNA